MTQKNIPSRAELIKQTFNTRRYRETNLFDSIEEKPYYWKLSDLAILYPNLFDIKKPISQYTVHKINSEIKTAIPAFTKLTEQPVHVLTLKDSYNLYVSETNTIRTVKSGKNQNLTNVACEYLFRQYSNTELEQAYFLYPSKTGQELMDTAQELKFEKIRTQIAQTSNLLSAIINRANGATKSSFSEIWSLIWHTLYNVNSMDTLREKYNVKTSPIDYMKPQTLIFMNAMLQEIVLKFANQSFYTIDDIRKHARMKASFARAQFFKYGSSPEKQLTEKSSYTIIEKLRRARERFWQKYYPLSLVQR